jgi:hypothetical protein
LALAFPAMFWTGLWIWRREALGYVVAGVLLLKAALVGITLVVNAWVVASWGAQLDPMLPAYAVVGVGGLMLLIRYLRAVVPFRAAPSALGAESKRGVAPMRAA